MDFINRAQHKSSYKIKNVYYSNSQGEIVMERFSKMYLYGAHRNSSRFAQRGSNKYI